MFRFDCERADAVLEQFVRFYKIFPSQDFYKKIIEKSMKLRYNYYVIFDSIPTG